jgi:CRP-like cAMP-binding protein
LQGNTEHKPGWLKHVPLGLADKLLKAARKRRFDAGEVIYAVGQDQQSLFGIHTGQVRMFISVNEQPLRFAHVAGPGFWFGEFEFIMARPRIMEMVATKRVEVSELTREMFDPLARQDPEAWHAVARLTALNQAINLGAADDLILKESLPRLAAVLLRLAGYRNAFQGTPPMDQIPVTQRELADSAGLSLSKTTALLSNLVKEGAIATDYGSIKIRNEEYLKALLS